jgi:hypothetical protein
MTVKRRDTLLGYLRRHRHTALLATIVAALAARPVVGDVHAGPMVFSVAMLLVLLAALLTVQVDELVGDRQALLVQRRRQSVIAWMLAVPAVAERLYVLVAPSPRQYLIGSVFWFLFLSFVTWNQLGTLLKHKRVTGETISMSISVYLLLGMVWAILYMVMLQVEPQAFRFEAAMPKTGIEIFPVLIYFSLTTLTTVGFGDIIPLTLPARYAAVAEAITGQFYLAILVARLVGLHMAQSVASGAREPARAPESEEPLDPSAVGDEGSRSTG